MKTGKARKTPFALLAMLCLAGLLLFGRAEAAELVMFDEKGCPWCAAWDAEVGRIYDKTPEAKRAPLRRVDIHAPRPQDLRDLKAIVYTPTFVLLQDGREVGRIQGYPGVDHFWALLGMLLEELEVEPAS